jgi:diaminobutyrate-2-oxoglutarate transaminase
MSTTIDVTNAAVFERRESEVRNYCQNVDPLFNAASGSINRDGDGRDYIDFPSSASPLNYGHNEPNPRSSLTEYLMREGMTHCSASTKQQRTALL